MAERELTPSLGDIIAKQAEEIHALQRHTHLSPAIPEFPEPGGAYTFTVAAVDTPSPVKDRADYICTGEGDDSVIQLALDRADEISGGDQVGGTIQLTPGHFNLDGNIYLGEKCRLRGAGREATFLNGASILSKTVLDPLNNILSSNAVEALTVEFTIFLGGQGALGSFNTGVVMVRDCQAACIGLIVPTGLAWALDNRVLGSATISDTAGGEAANIFARARASFIRGNRIGPNAITRAISVCNNVSSGAIISDNIVSISSGHGILLKAWVAPNIAGCLVSNNSLLLQSGSNTHDGITIDGGGGPDTKHVGVYNNEIMSDPNSAATWRYGIVLTSDTVDCTLAHNCVESAATADVLDSGTNNMDWMTQCGGSVPLMGGVPLLSGREYATVVVAAVDSHQEGKDSANFLCSGVVDEATIESAIASLPTIGGWKQGRVLLLEGTYTFASPCDIDTGVRRTEIRGMGFGTRIIGGAFAAFRVGNAAVSNYPTHIKFADMFIDCNDAAGSRGIQQAGAENSITDCVVEHVWVDSARTRGIEAAGDRWHVRDCVVTGTSTVDHQGIYIRGDGTRVERCYVDQVSTAIESAIPYASIRDNEIEDCAIGIIASGFLGTISDNRIGACDVGPGIRLSSSNGTSVVGNTIGYLPPGAACIDVISGSEGPLISGNTIDSPDGIGIRTVVDFTQIVGNQVDWNGEEGIVVDGANDCQIQNNRFNGGGWSTTDTYDAIFLTGSDRATIQANVVRSVDYRYGINVSDAASDDVMVCDNDLLDGFVTADVNDAGTGTRPCPDAGTGSGLTSVIEDPRYRMQVM